MTVALGLFLVVAQATAPAQGQALSAPGLRLDADPAGAGVHSSCSPRMAATRERLHVVWQDARDPEWAIYYRRGDADGSSWDARDVRLSDPDSHAVEPRIVASEGCVHVAWRTVAIPGRPGGEWVAARSSLDDGRTWSDVARLRPEPGGECDFVAAPALESDGFGGACLAWVQAIGEEDHALVAVHDGHGATWPRSPTQLTKRGKSGTAQRATSVRVAAVSRKARGRGRVVVAYVDRSAGRGGDAAVVLRGSSDAGVTFPAELTSILGSGVAPGSIELAANDAGAVHVVWPAVDDKGRPCLLAQRSLAAGAPGTWLERPLRIDDATKTRVLCYDTALAVDASGDAYATYAVARQDGARLAIELVANAFPADAPAELAWKREQVLSIAAQRGLAAPVRLHPRIAIATASAATGAGAGSRAAAICWTEDPVTSPSGARVWLGATSDRGASWSVRPLDGAATPDSPRADQADLVLRSSGRTPRAAVVWDDRRFWTAAPGEFRTGMGAPETCFLISEIPCTSPPSR